FGFNYYVTSERFLDERLHLYHPSTHGGNTIHSYADVEAVRVEMDEEIGVEVLLKEAWERYKKPIAITEVHLHCHREEQLRWFKYVWEAAKNQKSNGVNIVSVTAWAMFGSYGWNKLLTQSDGEYEPGVFDMQGGTPRPTALKNFIYNIAAQDNEHHSVSHNKGWWQRSNRFFHKPLIIESENVFKQHKAPVLIIGKRGTLGNAFARTCEQRFINNHLLSREDCDISDYHSIEKAIEHYKPWAIINAAGYVRVDDAENDFDACFRDNVMGPQNLAIACQEKGIKLVTFSSDLVFDGSKRTPYKETDKVAPLNVYGKSKASAERLVSEANPSSLIIRTSAFFSPWDQYNFLFWVINNLKQEQEIPIANDVIISPTYLPDLVNASLDLLIDDENGIWHLINKGAISWADLAYEVAHAEGLQNKWINAMPVRALNQPALRPQYSALQSTKGMYLPT
ncbi:MAG TPA: SDR family oxidoreductase, partial [Chitinophagaceae bacterium]|nr:SDR family oxidoreductase [Chitinophagaceae bacterium]